MTPQLPVPVEPEKKETLPPREIIPSCVLKVTGEEDCPSVEDVLSASSLPSVDQARLHPSRLSIFAPQHHHHS